MKREIHKKLILGIVFLFAMVFGSLAYSHCQGRAEYTVTARVYAMKTKQTTDLANVNELRIALEKFHRAYAAR